MSKIKIELNCVYGNKEPGDIIELDEKVAAPLIKSGMMKLSVEKVTVSTKEAIALKGQLTKALSEIEALKKDNETLTLEIDKLLQK